MIDSELLAILCCPETKEDVKLITGDLIQKINQKISSGEIVNRGGKKVEEPIDSGLMRKDKKYLYPIREDIPIMLIDEAIPLKELV